MAYILGRGSSGSGGGGGGAPSGPAGGDLGGTYPNPTVPNLIPKTVVDAKGDLLVATAADTVARKAVGATNGMVLTAQSAQSDGLLWSLPPATELAYAQFTSTVNCTATTEATADTIVTAGAVTGDGSAKMLIEFFTPAVTVSATRNGFLILYDGSTALGRLGQAFTAGTHVFPMYVSYRLTPSAASHTYSVRGYIDAAGTFAVLAGAAGSGNYMPGFVRITTV